MKQLVRLNSVLAILSSVLSEATEEYKPTSAGINLYVKDRDATYKRALEAGATSISPPKGEFYGDRSARIRDQFENYWLLVIQRHPRFDLHQRGLDMDLRIWFL